MATALQEIAAKDTLIDEVESILWKYVYDILSEQEIKECLATALREHIYSLKEVGIILPKEEE